MDNIGRLTIVSKLFFLKMFLHRNIQKFLKVDGDTDTVPVQEDFKNVVKEHIDYIKHNTPRTAPGHTIPNGLSNGHIGNGHAVHQDTIIQDMESEPIETISNHVSRMTNGVNHMANGLNQIGNGHGPPKISGIGNGFTSKYASLDAERQENIRNMYNEVHVDNHI